MRRYVFEQIYFIQKPAGIGCLVNFFRNFLNGDSVIFISAHHYWSAVYENVFRFFFNDFIK